MADLMTSHTQRFVVQELRKNDVRIEARERPAAAEYCLPRPPDRVVGVTVEGMVELASTQRDALYNAYGLPPEQVDPPG